MAKAQDPRPIDRLLAQYGESHRNPTNKAIHWVAVPVIFWCVLALLWSVPLPAALGSNLVVPVIAAALIYYALLSRILLAGMICVVTISVLLILAYQRTSGLPPLPLAAAGLFVIAWVFQFVGHKVEGKRPSFLKDLQFLLIGPAWLMSDLMRRLGVAW